MAFSYIIQRDSKSIKDVAVCSKSNALDYKFSYPNLKFDLLAINVGVEVVS